MTAARTLPLTAQTIDPATIDQRVCMYGVSWATYEALLAWRGESSRPRMTYLEGELELMSPSRDRETLKKWLARLFEAFAEETGLAVHGAGSWTIRNKRAERGAEPDECYVLGEPVRAPKRPDIAIEVVWTRGGIDKLEVWRALGVPEVWIFHDGALTFHVLRGSRYAHAARSKLVPKLDPKLVARCMGARSQTAAVKLLRRLLREG